MRYLPVLSFVLLGLLPLDLFAATNHEAFTRFTTNRVVTPQLRKTFSFEGVQFDTDFDGSRACDITQANGGFVVHICPENEPINDSAWYAFRVQSATSRVVQITLSYSGGPHRYVPKISTDRKVWQLAREGTLREDNYVFQIEAGPTPVYVAAQELVTSSDIEAWASSLETNTFVKSRVIAKSVNGKAIRALEIGEAGSDSDWVIVVGRQHPPEVTGTFALQSFVSKLCDHGSPFDVFRKHFRVLVVPIVNPDGVDAGHWRHNAQGVDLNRDWGQFNQPETVQISQDLLQIKGRVRLALDFHSTRKDVFYTGQALGADRIGLQWLERLQQLAPDYPVRMEGGTMTQGATPTRTAASWFQKHMGAPAITYEVGDNTDRALARRIAENAALALAQTLLPKPERAASTSSNKPLRVALYSGKGVMGAGPTRIKDRYRTNSLIDVKEISPAEIKMGKLREFNIVIFPGGSGSGQGEALGEDGREQVRNHVRGGGGYIGICAGAYLACSGFSWGVGVLDAKTVSPLWQRGSGMVELELTKAGVSMLGNPSTNKVKYENGPILAPAGDERLEDFVTLGRFATEVAQNNTPKGIMKGAPAAVCSNYGGGRVVCFSPHPEQTPGLETLLDRAIEWAAAGRN